MNTILLIFPGDDLDASIPWGMVENGSLLEAGRIADASALPGLRRRAEEADVVAALLPGEHAAIHHIAAPPKAAAKFKAAAAFMLEDELSEPLESIHFVTHSVPTGGFVVATKTALMDRWMDAFDSAKIDLSLLSTDAAILIGNEEDAVLLRGKSRTVAACRTLAFACENALFDITGQSFAEEVGDASIQVLGEEDDLPDFIRDLSPEWLGPFGKAKLFELFADAVSKNKPANLLQGPYRRKTKWRAEAGVWRNAALIAAGLATIVFASVAAEAWRNDRISQQWAALGRMIHEQNFPDRSSVDPVSNARAMLSTSSGNTSFLTLSTQFSDAIERNEDVQIDRIGFDRTQGRFTVSIRSTSDSAIEKFREDLTDMGVTVRDNGGFRQSRGQWVGELLAEAS